MERSLIKQVNSKNMEARLSGRTVKPVYFLNFFGIKQKSSLKWESLSGEKGAPVIADVISFDSSAPQKKREVVGKVSGDIPKTAISRAMNESEWNEYQQLSRDAQGDAGLVSLLDLSFNDLDFCYNGVRGRFEWWCMQLMSKGGFDFTLSNNNGIVTETFVGCGMPAANKMKSATDWAASATADGLQDIEDTIVTASSAGINIKYVIMRSSDFALLKKQKATADKLKGWVNNTNKLTITKQVVNDYLAAQEKPVTIVIVDPSVRIEDKSHNRTAVNPWESKRVCFVEDVMVGDIQHGPIAAEGSEAYKKLAITVKKDFVFTSKWSELNPFKEWTMAEANAIPVINDPEGMFIMKVDGADWDSNDTEATDK